MLWVMGINRWKRLPMQTRFTVVFVSGLFIILFTAIVAIMS
jgi:hypothetical protein